jgi:hypothetical protein
MTVTVAWTQYDIGGQNSRHLRGSGGIGGLLGSTGPSQ